VKLIQKIEDVELLVKWCEENRPLGDTDIPYLLPTNTSNGYLIADDFLVNKGIKLNEIETTEYKSIEYTG
tara:strand:+ start:976 stop:1185 length:210 start_codon:yes stop_codon:yes gene_type:complete